MLSKIFLLPPLALLLAGCGGAGSPSGSDGPGGGRTATLPPPCAGIEDECATPRPASRASLVVAARNPDAAVRELTNSAVHRTSDLLAAYKERAFGRNVTIGIVSSSLAGYAPDLRETPLPPTSLVRLPLDQDTTVTHTFGSAVLNDLPTDLPAEYHVPDNDFVFNYDSTFSFQLDPVDGVPDPDRRLDEIDISQDDFKEALARDLGLLVSGTIGLIIEDYRTVGTAAAIIATGRWHALDSPYAVLGTAPEAGLHSYPVENFYRQYCYRLERDAHSSTSCSSEHAARFRRILHARSIGMAATGLRRDVSGTPAPNELLPASDIIYSSYIGSDYRTDEEAIRREYSDFLTALQAAKDADKIVVLGAGDDGLTTPALPAALPAVETDLQTHVLTVVATDADGDILESSNRCGIRARAFCIAIVGDDLLTVWLNPRGSDAQTEYNQPYYSTYFTAPVNEENTDRVSGTHYAAAAAAGAVAVVASHFSDRATMSRGDILQRIKDTANNEGQFASVNTYGLGLLDVGAAIAPVSRRQVPLQASAFGSAVPLDTGVLRQISSAVGDALQQGLAGRRIIVLDSLHSPFLQQADQLLHAISAPEYLSPAGLLHRAEIYPTRQTRLQIHQSAQDSSQIALAWQAGPAHLNASHSLSPGLSSGLAAENLAALHPGAAAVTMQTDSAFLAPWAMAHYQWQTAGGAASLPAGLQLRWMKFTGETAHMADALSAQAGRRQSGSLLSVTGGRYRHKVGAQLVSGEGQGELLGIVGDAGVGRTDMRAANLWGIHSLTTKSTVLWSLWQLDSQSRPAETLLSAAEGLRSDAWALGYATGNWLVRLEQPLRARSGDLLLRLPWAHRADRTIDFARLRLGAEPSGRETRLQLDFTAAALGGNTQFSLGMAHEPGHIRHRASEPYAMLSIRVPLH